MGERTVGLRDLGQNVSEVLSRIQHGEVLTVSEFGRPVARLVPFTNPAILDHLIDSGVVSPATRSAAALLEGHSVEVSSDETLSDALWRDREDRV